MAQDLTPEEGECMRGFRAIIFDIIREIESNHNLQLSSYEYIHSKLQWFSRLLGRYSSIYPFDNEIERLIRAACNCFDIDSTHGKNRRQWIESDGQKGRPRIIVSQEQLEFLVGLGFSTVNIASLLGVSESTVKRRLSDFGIPVRGSYTELTDDQLDAVILSILQDFPNTGYKRMTGFLRSRGLRVQQLRIRESIRRVDPAGVLLRSLEMRITQRRRYQVPGPLALWHIDGNHKLIRYLISRTY